MVRSDRFSSHAQVGVLVNSPPDLGNVTVSPRKGTALSTTFQLAAQQWSDPEGNLPLTYSFSAVYPSGTSMALSLAANLSSSLSVTNHTAALMAAERTFLGPFPLADTVHPSGTSVPRPTSPAARTYRCKPPSTTA